MYIKKHPLHLMLVHFPVGLLPMDLFCSILALRTDDRTFLFAGFYALAGAVVFGWLAVITGTIDLITWKGNDAKEDQKVIGKGLIHGGIQIIVIMIYTGLAFLENYPYLEYPATGVVVTKTVLVMSMFIGNYFGGELVLKHLIKKKSNGRQ
ncbi:hypothetical protein C900_04879 [Fulvivirga imtechensis AK7]|uniref:DUF2231 domain-containing protein n=1 Tax=Fulvivirga imtechensis AK7 TaxID=1237149 RepID=L8JQ93_9BACT|nr:DUF2231 domain-containing protein [Fulvivirga imtechensis]ELR69654.1 hypothetical protein C900_04879 [Fulvivirga imtechensis AK7]